MTSIKESDFMAVAGIKLAVYVKNIPSEVC